MFSLFTWGRSSIGDSRRWLLSFNFKENRAMVELGFVKRRYGGASFGYPVRTSLNAIRKAKRNNDNDRAINEGVRHVLIGCQRKSEMIGQRNEV